MKKPRMTTSQVLAERRRELARKQREERDAYLGLEPLIRELCDGGLVDDVDPDPNPTATAPLPRVTFTCGHCGTNLGEEPICRRCM